MKQFCLFLLLVCFVPDSFNISAQEVIRYAYDEAGNRKLKELLFQQKIENINDSSSDEESKTVSITDNTFNSQVIKIFPNPTNGIIEIEIPEDTENTETVQISIIDINGKVIANKPQYSFRTILDISNQPDGIYFMNLKKGVVVSQWKIIKK